MVYLLAQLLLLVYVSLITHALFGEVDGEHICNTVDAKISG